MSHPRYSLAMIIVLVLGGPGTLTRLQAQELPRSFGSVRYVPAEGTVSRPFHIELGDSTLPRSYWLEGALIAGVPLALLGAGLAGWGCSDDETGGACWDNELVGALVGFGTGVSLGAMIGGQIKKGGKKRKEANQQVEPAAQDSTESTP